MASNDIGESGLDSNKDGKLNEDIQNDGKARRTREEKAEQNALRGR